MIIGCVIRRNAPISIVMSTNENVGNRLGRVIRKNFCLESAPSIAAAS